MLIRKDLTSLVKGIREGEQQARKKQRGKRREVTSTLRGAKTLSTLTYTTVGNTSVWKRRWIRTIICDPD